MIEVDRIIGDGNHYRSDTSGHIPGFFGFNMGTWGEVAASFMVEIPLFMIKRRAWQVVVFGGDDDVGFGGENLRFSHQPVGNFDGIFCGSPTNVTNKGVGDAVNGFMEVELYGIGDRLPLSFVYGFGKLNGHLIGEVNPHLWIIIHGIDMANKGDFR